MKYSPERIAEITAKRLQTRAANRITEQKSKAERQERLEMEKDYLGREVMRLRTLVKELNDQSPLLDVCRQMTGRTLHTETEIVAVSEPYVRLCGIYFLVAGDRVVYVGQSVNIAGRIGTHANTKKFDRVAFVPCEEEHMNILESLYIHILRPPLNGNSNSKGLKTAPITMQEMLRYIGPAYDLARGIVKAQQNVVA